MCDDDCVMQSVELLLKRNADVDPRNASRATPLHHAAMGNHTQVATLLLKAKVCELTLTSTPNQRCVRRASNN